MQSSSYTRLVAEETFGERLSRLRSEKGLSRTQLAFRVGISEGAIRQLESGQSKSASFPVGIRLARELGVDAAYLALGHDGEDTANGEAEAPLEASMEARIAGLEDRQARSIEQVAQMFLSARRRFELLSRFLEARGILTANELERLLGSLETGD